MDSILPDETSETHSPKSVSASPMDSIVTSETQSLSFSTREHKTQVLTECPIDFPRSRKRKTQCHIGSGLIGSGLIGSTLLSSVRREVDRQPDRKDNILPAVHGNHFVCQLESDYMFPNGRGDTRLHVAARAGQLDIVKSLIGIDYESRKRIHSTEVGMKNNKGNLALHEALEYKHEEVARFLVKAHPELCYLPNNEGKTPEYLAAELCYLPNNEGKTPDNNEGKTPEYLAAELCYLPNNEGKTPEDLAAEAGPRKLLEVLWESTGSHFIYPQGEAMTALHAAIIRRDPGCVELVLKHKPQLIRVTDSKGRNPLHYAASIGNYEGLNELLKNPQAAQAAYQPDIFGHYPIHEAASAGHIKVIKLLLKFCPDSWKLLGKEGQSILHVGVQRVKENVVSYILKTQAVETLINDLDANGNTPLHLATKGSHFKVVRVLTSDNRVNMSICNNDNLTALDIAERNIVKGGSLRRLLTLTTLRIANAPRARNLDLLGDHEDRKVYIMPPPKAEDFKERVNTLLLVSTLVATVTFAGGFTIPGGLTSDGMATKLTNSKFKAFVICDAIALFCSILAVVSLIWAQLGEVSVIRFVIDFTVMLLGISLSMMVIAFSVGLYIVTSQIHWLASAVLIMGTIFLICILIVLLPLQMPLLTRYRIIQRISYVIFFLLALVIGANSDEDDDIRKDYVWKERKERKRKTGKEKKGEEQHKSSAC